MEFREASPGDADDVRAIARASLAASYEPALDEEAIEAAVDSWYDAETVAEAVADEETLLVLAVEGGDVVGFAKGVVVGRREPVGEIHWLHVAPDYRGRGVGTRLLEEIEHRLHDAGAKRYTGFVLAVNEGGVDFYETHDYERAGERETVIGDREFVELEFDHRPEGEPGRRHTLRPVNVHGGTRYVAYDEEEHGSLAPFYPLYEDRRREKRYGYLCGNCETADVVVDTMGRYRCNTCENKRKPTRWDAAYL